MSALNFDPWALAKTQIYTTPAAKAANEERFSLGGAAPDLSARASRRDPRR